MSVVLPKMGQFEHVGMYGDGNVTVRQDIVDLLKVLAEIFKVLSYTSNEFTIYSVTTGKALVSFSEQTENYWNVWTNVGRNNTKDGIPTSELINEIRRRIDMIN